MPTPQIRADVAAAREGDDEAFERLVEATYSEIFTLAARLTQNHEDALDVVQEAYLRAYRGLIDFRGEARFSTWMHRITVNCASTLLTRRNRYRCDEIQHDVVDLNGEYHPERRLEDAEISFEVRSALNDLPTNLRVVVVLRDIFDLSHAEIANQLGISATAVKVRLHRGRKRMRVSVQTSREIREPIVAANTSYRARHAM
ncbi:MAG TPA: RNA polymerase subunit sigma-24 [Acidimicrobiaceae bacterium]|nr:RNA polymerase subunit sigma-24 [Acidimicrobiaceae bacterium]HAX05893.1 RNA polymerase subunit sigma-24 [Acidimicrobiaceae bacterium]|tara:strand:- start:348 stop:950 length:603 start_codon:yes stop_codon:yes gene_type:complete